MHFRERDRVVQVIRTRYDAGAKRARAEIVGRLDKARPEITDEMRQRCSPAELAEISRWIAEGAAEYRVGPRQRVAAVRRQLDALAAWLQDGPPSDDADACVRSLFEHWWRFRRQLRLQGRAAPVRTVRGRDPRARNAVSEASSADDSTPTTRLRLLTEPGAP
jgi:hypothetical protein